MLTLQELKEITETTKHGIKMPTARNLRETGRAVAEKILKMIHGSQPIRTGMHYIMPTVTLLYSRSIHAEPTCMYHTA